MSVLVENDPLMVTRNRRFRSYSNRHKVDFTAGVAGKSFVDRSRLSDLNLGSRLTQAAPTMSWPEDSLITALHHCTNRALKLRLKEISSAFNVSVSWDNLSSYWKAIALASEQPLAKWREETRAFSSLPKGWDSYNAGPPSQVAIDIALSIIDALEESGTSPDYIIPTSDDSILFKHAFGDFSYLWEIESDGEIGLMIESAEGNSTFHSVNPSQVLNFLDDCEVNV